MPNDDLAHIQSYTGARHRIIATILADASSSVFLDRLEEPLIQGVLRIQRALGEDPRNRVFRATFASEQTDIDVTRPKELLFLHPTEQEAARPFRQHYRRGRGTALDLTLERELERLIRRSAQTGQETYNLLFVLTDGRNNKTDRSSRTRQLMREILDQADARGGFHRARVAAFYTGVGLSRERHFEQAHRLGFPQGWIDWCPADDAGVKEGTGRIARVVDSVSYAGDTIFCGLDDDDDGDDEREYTRFDIGGDR